MGACRGPRTPLKRLAGVDLPVLSGGVLRFWLVTPYRLVLHTHFAVVVYNTEFFLENFRIFCVRKKLRKKPFWEKGVVRITLMAVYQLMKIAYLNSWACSKHIGGFWDEKNSTFGVFTVPL